MKDERKQLASMVTEVGVNVLDFHDPRLFRDLLGQHDQHIKILQTTLQLKIRVRGAALEIEGDPIQVELASQILRQLYGLLEKGYPVYASDVDYAIRILSGDSRARLARYFPRYDLHFGAQTHDYAEEHRAKSLHRRNPALRHRLRHRTGRHRQDLPGNGDGGRRVDEE